MDTTMLAYSIAGSVILIGIGISLITYCQQPMTRSALSDNFIQRAALQGWLYYNDGSSIEQEKKDVISPPPEISPQDYQLQTFLFYLMNTDCTTKEYYHNATTKYENLRRTFIHIEENGPWFDQVAQYIHRKAVRNCPEVLGKVYTIEDYEKQFGKWV